jgi:hypothetical protein
MRRLSLLPLVLLLALALVACGGTKSPTAPGDTSGDNNGEPIVISAAVGGPNTADPNATPQPQPTALPTLGVTIENVQYKAQGNGSVTFSAQVANLGTEEVRVTKVIIELFDANGERITRMSFSSPALPSLKPGEGATWEGQRGGLDVEWAETRASIAAEPLTATAP